MTPEQKQAVRAWAEEVLQKWCEAEAPRCSDEFTPGTAYVEFDVIPAYRARLNAILTDDDCRSVIEELPSCDQDVLIYADNGRRFMAYRAESTIPGKVIWCTAGSDEYNVDIEKHILKYMHKITHWRPLPAGPSEE